MGSLVFPTSSAPGLKPQEGAGRLVNGYAVKAEQGARGPLVWKRSAGLRETVSTITGHSHCRGLSEVAGTVLIVLDERVYSIAESSGVFTATNLGELTGTDNVTIARNNAATPNIVAVTDDGTFNLFTNSAPTAFVDGDLPAVNSVTGVNGYFIWTTAGGALWASGLNAVSVASNANALVQTNPHGLLRGVYFRGEFFAWGKDGAAVYEETGASPFPLEYKKIFIPVGLIGSHAITGFENGWAGQVVWIAPDYTVRQLSGYAANVVSNDAVSNAIKSAADTSLIEASCYTDGKNAFAVFTSPGEWSWELNVSTGAWDERASYGRDDWRGRKSVFAFDRWIVGDDESGLVAAIDSTYKKEFNDALIWMLRSGPNPQYNTRDGLEFDITAALGSAPGADPIETDPVAMIRYSVDGGYNFSSQLTRPLGAQGQGDRRVIVNRLGMLKAKGLVVELSISDPVSFEFYGAGTPRRMMVAA
jgi:hypothetical protein